MDRESKFWLQAPDKLVMLQDEVHIWRASMVVTSTRLVDYKRMLSPEECKRAERYYFEKDRSRWIVARGLLRILLGRYLQVPPEQPGFVLNEYGKPELASPYQESGLRFNISHSQDIVLYAFTYGRALGIDVEYMRTNIDCAELARHSFSSAEYATWSALPEEQKTQGFFNCWSRKEAYIKARGMGLSLPLKLFDVALTPGEPAALLHSREDPQEVHAWSMQALEPGSGYAGALVVEGHDWKLRGWQG